MKYHILKTRFLSFIIPFFLFGVIFLSCTGFIEDNESEPDAQVPEISSISEDKTTTINTAVELKVGVMISDKGILGYQWYKAADKLSNGEIVDGAVSETFSPSVENAGLFYYYCIITNQLGNSRRSVTSPRISVIVKERVDALVPMIVEQPTNVTAEIGEEFSLKVTAFSKDGVSLSYQWYFVAESENISTSESSGDEAVSERTATAIQGATESSYFGDVSLANLGTYFCVVTNRIEDNGDGGIKTASVTSNKVIVSDSVVNANAPLITAQPISDTAIIPATRVFSVGAYSVDEGELSYQWYSVIGGTDSANDTVRGVAIDGATEASYKVTATEIGKTGYYCIVTNTIPDNGDGGIKTASVKSETAWFEAVYLRDVVSKPQFTKQPVSMSVAPYNQGVLLACEAESDGYTVIYRWYESTDGTTSTGTVVIGGSGANTANFTTPAFTERGIRYFYCVATNLLSDEDGLDVKSASAISDVVSVAYTGLPVIVINTVDGEEPTAEYTYPPDGAYGRGIKNATKVPAQMKIFKDGKSKAIYDSGEYVKKTSGLTIKLRGNTSVSLTGKSPYKLKLQKKADLLADLLGRSEKEYKDKDWILLKDGTSLNTFVGMAVADLAGTSWTPEFAFVNVVINDNYRGTYLLIEAISDGEKRINIAEDGYIIERDAYWWNEDVKFITTRYNQKYTFKYPDDDDITTEQITYIEDYMNTLETHVADGTYEDYLDTASFARWLLIHDILGTWDSGGSNVYMSKYDSTESSKIFMCTTWDYDSNYSMKNTWANQHNGTRIYAEPLLTSTNKTFKDSYKAQWENLSVSLWSDLYSKLNELNANQGEDINLSRKCDAKRWNGTASTVEKDITTAKNWFDSRIPWLDSAINGL